MKAIAVVPKVAEVVPARTMQFTNIIWRTVDDCFARRLQIIVNDSASFFITGDAYDQLDQWTDDTIQTLIFEKYGLAPL